MVNLLAGHRPLPGLSSCAEMPQPCLLGSLIKLLGFRFPWSQNVNYYHPQTKFSKVMLLHVLVILSTGEGLSQHALQVSRSTPRGGSWGVWPGGSPGPNWGGVSRPTPGDLQTHTQGVINTHTRRGVYPGMHWGKAPHPPYGYYCGNYASYWNAFLFLCVLRAFPPCLVVLTKCVTAVTVNRIFYLKNPLYGTLSNCVFSSNISGRDVQTVVQRCAHKY